MRAHVRVGKGDRRAKLTISLEPMANTANVFSRFAQGRTQQTENMNVSTVLSELAPTSAGSSRQIKPLQMSMNCCFSLYDTKVFHRCAKLRHYANEIKKITTKKAK